MFVDAVPVGVDHPHTEGSPSLLRKMLPGAVISLAFTAFFVLGIHWEDLRQVPSRVDPTQILLAAGVLFLEFPLRALRWRVLLLPLQQTSSRPPLSLPHLLRITLIGYLANLLLPARAGELVRPAIASRDGGLPLPAMIVLCVFERVFDIVGLVGVLVSTAWLLPQAGAVHLSTTEMAWLSTTTRMLAGLSLAALVGLFTFSLRAQAMRPWVEAAAAHLPGPVGRLTLRLFGATVQGLWAFRGGWGPVLAGLLSLLIWFNGGLAIWILMSAFGIILPWAAAGFLQVTIALAVAPPQLPGFIGLFQFATQKTLQVWGVDIGLAQGFAMAFWLVSFAPLMVTGGIALWSSRLSLTTLLRELRDQLPRDPTPP